MPTLRPRDTVAQGDIREHWRMPMSHHLRSRKEPVATRAPCLCLAYELSPARVLAIHDLAKT
jgi:hypothetical protein